MTVPHLSVVVPVYNSQETLRELVARLTATLADVAHELIFVDDGSRDQSWTVLQELQAKHPQSMMAIQLMRNFGQHNALMCGLRHSHGAFVVTIDDDLQNPPEEIHTLLTAIESHGLDLVYGSYGVKQHQPWRNLGSWVVNRFFRTVFRVPVTVTSFRIMRRELVQSVLSYTLNFTFLDGLLAWNTQRIGETPVAHLPRPRGTSGYSISKLLVLALNLFTNFSLLPLQLVSLVGFLTASAGMLTGLFYLLRFWLNEITVPGYTSIIISVLVMGGVQLLSLGIIGEYLGRLHLNVNRKPQYTIRNCAAQSSGKPALAELEAHHP